jgi:hypothetical protein
MPAKLPTVTLDYKYTILMYYQVKVDKDVSFLSRAL